VYLQPTTNQRFSLVFFGARKKNPDALILS
jgi:hypothetical protein